MRHVILGLMLLLGARLPVVAAEAPAAGAPTEVVSRLNAALVEVMKGADHLGYQGRYDILAPVMAATHDFEAVAKIAVGRHWKSLSEEQRTALVARLVQFSVASYAAQFDAYDGEEFVFQSEQAARGERVTVQYSLKARDEPEHKFVYTLQQVDGAWRIVNTVVDGFSNLASMKAQYEQVLDSEGFDGLMHKLAERVDNYAKSRVAKGS